MRALALLLALLCSASLGLIVAPAQAWTTPLRIGARTNDISFTQADAEVGPLTVTRLFYRTLPPTFSRQGIPDGVLLIVSYKTPDTNVAAYVASIPAHTPVTMVFHHEPEADYADGATFVSEFNAQQKLVKAANPRIYFAFIGTGYAYRTSSSAGASGSFIPPNATRYYLDTYQRDYGYSPIRPASQDPGVQRYMTLLAAKGKQLNGFTEYGRGVVDSTHPLTDAMVQDRVSVYAADDTYLRSLPGFRVWSYWYGTGAAGQWRLTDATSQQAWRAITNQ